METETKRIMGELRKIKIDIEFIKEHMVDADVILTPEEEARLNTSLEEFKQGNTTPLEEFEKEV